MRSALQNKREELNFASLVLLGIKFTLRSIRLCSKDFVNMVLLILSSQLNKNSKMVLRLSFSHMDLDTW